MPYLFIENFEAGLDTRKSRFTAPPGSLRQCVNAHITRGKEIEKRKAFVDKGSLDFQTRGLHSVGPRLFTFQGIPSGGPVTSAVPNGVAVQGLNMDGAPSAGLDRVWFAENFAGKIYVIAESIYGIVRHFYDAQRVTDWDTIAADLMTTETIAAALALRLQGHPEFLVTVRDDVITIEAQEADASFDVNAGFQDIGELTFTEVTAGADPTPAVGAQASFTVSGGSADPGANQITNVLLDGYDLIGSAVDHTGSDDTTAQAVVDAINTSNDLYYTASRSGAVVTITADSELGSTPNGRVLEVNTSGDVDVTSVTNMSGGAGATAGQRSVWTVQVDNAFDTGFYAIDVEGSFSGVRRAFIQGQSSAMPLAVRTLGQKMYAVTGSLLYFSGFRGGYDGANQTPALPDPTAWQNFDNQTDEYVIGAGIINLAEHTPYSENAVGLGIYQGRLAVFSERSIQIWRVDPDPDLNAIEQVLLNIGAVSSRAIVEYGDIDIFFLSESGVRSLRARDSSNIASTTDVGSPIDGEVLTYLRTLSRDELSRAHAIVEPEDGRYLLSVGDRVYVFSNFPGSRVSAWTRYEGRAPTDWTVAGGRLYYRGEPLSGMPNPPLYLYGGDDSATYDASPVTVELPFLEAGNPAGRKKLTGVDVGVEGTWEVEFASEPNNPDARELIGTMTESTYGSFPQVRATALSTHFSLYFTNEDEGPAVLANAILHYDDIKAD